MADADGATALNVCMGQNPLRTMLRNAVALALFVCGAALGAANATDEIVLELNPAQSEINFTLPDVLHTVHGTFHLKNGTVLFDPATGKASGAVIVDVTSG